VIHACAGGFGPRLLSLIRKEFRQLLRDRSNLAMGLLLPVVLIFIFGYGLSLDVRDAPVAVVLEDRSPAAADVLAGLGRTQYLAPVAAGSMREAERMMLDHQVDAIVRVPGDFSPRLAEGRARVQVIVHGGDAARAITLRGYLTAALGQWAVRAADRGDAGAAASTATGGGAGAVAVQERMWFNAANSSTWYLVPGLIVLIMTLVGAFLTAMVMAREWERGTLEALFVTPVRPAEILIAKIVPYFAVGVVGLALCLLAARLLFRVPMHGSFALVVAGSVLYLLVALGLGLLISAVTRNQFMASQVALLASFMPSMMLSGFLFDLRNVPDVIRWIGQALPATYFMELIRTLFLAGNVWPLVLKDCAVLAAYAVALLAAARLATRKRLD